MPALTDLDKRLKLDKKWLKQYEENFRHTQEIRERIPLIHVRNNFFDLLLTPPYQIPVTNESSNDETHNMTRNAELELDLPPSIYFYAGRAYRPVFAAIAVVFTYEVESNHTGTVTPFDTGDLAAGRIKSNLPNNKDSRREFVQASCIELQKWRGEFAKFWAAYFENPSDYWGAGRPWKIDPEEIFLEKNNNKWPSWTFEVRFSEPISLKSIQTSPTPVLIIKWCFTGGRRSKLREYANKSSPFDLLPSWFIERQLPAYVDPCDKLEKWIQGEIGL
jgi:hypothetical protein